MLPGGPACSALSVLLSLDAQLSFIPLSLALAQALFWSHGGDSHPSMPGLVSVFPRSEVIPRILQAPWALRQQGCLCLPSPTLHSQSESRFAASGSFSPRAWQCPAPLYGRGIAREHLEPPAMVVVVMVMMTVMVVMTYHSPAPSPTQPPTQCCQ